MKLKVDDFITLVRKATVDYKIDSFMFNVTQDKINSGLRSSEGIISILSIPNDIIRLDKNTTELSLPFSDPRNFTTYLQLFDDKEVDLKVDTEKIRIQSGRQSSNIFFCHPDIVPVFSKTSPREGLLYFYETNINDDFLAYFSKIKKVSVKIGKVYIGVENCMFYIESSDSRNNYANTLRCDIGECKSDNKKMCLDYKNLVSIFNILTSDVNYKFSCVYDDEQDLGMVQIENEDKSEKYYLSSIME